ncbi:MAG: ABC transporter permease [Oscillospiraceae bacterium]|jgi:putative ABC transport system permease protein|nr:ABC transporter permease [Oscillospiraceae bacterium]
MKLTAKLAYSQLKTNKSRTVWTLLGIALSTAMITAVFGFAASGDAMMKDMMGGRDYYERMYYATLYGVGAVLGAIIVFASVVVVSNAFRVSAGERMRQFGLLKSVGATKKQIAKIIMREGGFLSAIGIPIGIALGLIVHLIGIRITDYFFATINRLNETQIVLDFIIAWHAIFISIVLSSVTVWLSAWLPARKAARIAAIDAIRGAGERRGAAANSGFGRGTRGGKSVHWLFGFEGTLASKSLKRSKRNFRATVVSLTVSVTLFITVSSFGAMMETTTDIFYPEMNVTAAINFYTARERTYGDDGEVVEYKYSTIGSTLADEITDTLREYPNTAVFGAGIEAYLYEAEVPSAMMTERMENFFEEYGKHQAITVLMVLDGHNYELLCKKAGVPLGSNILVNYVRLYLEGGQAVFTPYIFDEQTLQITNKYTDEAFELTLHGSLTIQDLPAEVRHSSVGTIAVIVPKLEASMYTWFADVSNSAGFLEYAEDVLYGAVTLDELSQLQFMDIATAEEASANVGQMVMVFVYGFIALLTLIGLTNVISTISANIRSRSQEFAVLRSVGMAQVGLNRMLNLESILCSAKSLIIGVPLGVAGSLITYNAMVSPAEFSYSIPWIPIVQSILAVFVITWIVMRYSALRLRGGSIVEAIRADSGM